jgi:hypothetical protein
MLRAGFFSDFKGGDSVLLSGERDDIATLLAAISRAVLALTRPSQSTTSRRSQADILCGCSSPPFLQRPRSLGPIIG